MTTTHLFVELLVIGFGALAWLVLLVSALFGFDLTDLDRRFLSLTGILPLLSIVYVLGILIDRVADWLFEPLDVRHREAYFGEDRDFYFDARRTLVVHGPALWEHLEYGRSRLRICRGWVLNGGLLLIAFDIFAYTHREAAWTDLWKITVCNLFLIVLGVLCFACWRVLNQKEYKKIQRQAGWIETMKNREQVESNGRQDQS